MASTQNKLYSDFASSLATRNGQQVEITDGEGLFKYIRRVSFQLSNLCNYTAFHKKCPLHGTREKQILPSGIVFSTLEELGSEYKGCLSFHIYNEPLIDPRFFWFAEKALQMCPKARLTVYTNGFFLNETMIDELARFNPAIVASAYSTAEYKRLSALKAPFPFMVFESSLDERTAIYDREIIDSNAPCNALVNDVSVTCTGKVALCCLDWNPQPALGDLAKESLESILSKPEVMELHKQLSKGKRTRTICQRCTWSR